MTEEELCKKCGLPIKLGCSFHNLPKNCEERPTFPYMEVGDAMHLECYIQVVVDTLLYHKMMVDCDASIIMNKYHKTALVVGLLLTLSLGHDLYGEFEFLIKSIICGCFGFLFPFLYKNK